MDQVWSWAGVQAASRSLKSTNHISCSKSRACVCVCRGWGGLGAALGSKAGPLALPLPSFACHPESQRGLAGSSPAR